MQLRRCIRKANTWWILTRALILRRSHLQQELLFEMIATCSIWSCQAKLIHWSISWRLRRFRILRMIWLEDLISKLKRSKRFVLNLNVLTMHQNMHILICEVNFQVIELPIKHPELFESLGIAQPKVRFLPEDHFNWFELYMKRKRLKVICFPGCSPLWTSRHRKDIAGTCSCSSHWLHLHQGFWFWVGSEIYWWGLPYGSWTLCHGQVGWFFITTFFSVITEALVVCELDA